MPSTAPEKTAVEVEAQAHPEKLNNAQTVEIDAAAEKRLLRKLDWHLIPPLMTVYFLSFMDRTNIGTPLPFLLLFAVQIRRDTVCHDSNMFFRQCPDPRNDAGLENDGSRL